MIIICGMIIAEDKNLHMASIESEDSELKL